MVKGYFENLKKFWRCRKNTWRCKKKDPNWGYVAVWWSCSWANITE